MSAEPTPTSDRRQSTVGRVHNKKAEPTSVCLRPTHIWPQSTPTRPSPTPEHSHLIKPNPPLASPTPELRRNRTVRTSGDGEPGHFKGRWVQAQAFASKYLAQTGPQPVGVARSRPIPTRVGQRWGNFRPSSTKLAQERPKQSDMLVKHLAKCGFSARCSLGDSMQFGPELSPESAKLRRFQPVLCVKS